MARISLARERARAGVWNDVIESAWERYKEGGRESLSGAVSDEIADRAVQRYDGKIRAMFARGGVPIDEGQELTVATLARIISDRTGLTIADLSPDTIMAAIDRELSARLSEALQVPVTTVFDKEALLESVKEGVRAAIADGRAADLLSRGAVMAARRYATWKRRSIEEREQIRIRNRGYQAKYRTRFKLVWE